MLIATTNEISGYEIDEVFGEVFGLTVRSRNMFSQFGAGLKSMVGGELKGMTKALHDSRQQLIDRMSDEAEAKGLASIQLDGQFIDYPIVQRARRVLAQGGG